jgi:transposase
MSYNFKECNRDQMFLLPPNIREWVKQDQLVWFVLDAVEQMDITGFYRIYREDGKGGSAFEPSMMLSLLLYAYCLGERSSRRIERLCEQDITFRIITANDKPDHATIARFRKQHIDLLEHLFVEVLKLCKEAKMVKLGVVALDGTKMVANASLAANKTVGALESEVKKMFQEAEATDAAEDILFGADRRGDELPEELQDRRSRLARLKQCKARLDEQAAQAKDAQQAKIEKRTQEEEQSGQKKRGRKLRPAKDVVNEEAKAHITDPQSRIMKTRSGYVQGYNAQAIATEEQIIIGADVTQEENDVNQVHPMLDKAQATLESANVTEPIKAAALDAGYFSEANVSGVTPGDPELYIATKKDWKQRKESSSPEVFSEPIPEGLNAKQRMEYKLKTEVGKKIYAKRKTIIEPIFGQIKDGRRIRTFLMRGIDAVKGEWNLICATHNLLKIFRRNALQMA